jgi:hypothetical protein
VSCDSGSLYVVILPTLEWKLITLRSIDDFVHERFFLEQMYLEHDGWNLIFYTGKTPLTSAIENANTNVRVIYGR